MVGSSAGALLSVLAACGVQPQAALDRAYELCLEHGVFKRPLGLLVSDPMQTLYVSTMTRLGQAAAAPGMRI
jgi:predicted acylesterase/phospholipase RssA